MLNFIIGTTPTITYKFKVVSPSDITTAILSIKSQNQNMLTKTLADASVGADSLSWTLTQEETLAIGARTVKMMLNWKTADGTRGASAETMIQGVQNHIREVI